MIPNETIDVIVTDEAELSKTYKITDNKLQGYTNGIEALKQAMYKVLNTEKYEYPIYSFSYGIELESLIGKDVSYVKIELKQRIQECLIQDERIKSIDNFSATIIADEMLCEFDVVSNFGEISITKEVNV